MPGARKAASFRPPKAVLEEARALAALIVVFEEGVVGAPEALGPAKERGQTFLKALRVCAEAVRGSPRAEAWHVLSAALKDAGEEVFSAVDEFGRWGAKPEAWSLRLCGNLADCARALSGAFSSEPLGEGGVERLAELRARAHAAAEASRAARDEALEAADAVWGLREKELAARLSRAADALVRVAESAAEAATAAR